MEQDHSSLASQLAEDLLTAWLSGNAISVRTELERSISVSVEVYDTGEQERRQLLKAVAARMQTCTDLLALQSQTPEVELYVRLLGHMVPVN
jgi:hypothetical protein